jgi:hypothetical protein
MSAADFRVSMPLPDFGERWLPVKDHQLLARFCQGSTNVAEQIEMLGRAVRDMGEQVAVRLGLSRSYQAPGEQGPTVCWLMADGFFSLSDPQP